MRSSIAVVRSDVNLYYEVALQSVVFCSRSAYYSISREHDDAIMACTDTDFILCTNHAVALYATKFALLDSETLIAVIEFATQLSHNHLLTGSYIWSTAHYLLHHSIAFIHCSDMHVVTIRMRFTSEHFAHYKAFKTTLYRLYFFYSLNFETHAGEGLAHFFSTHVKVNVLFQPFIRNVHEFIFCLVLLPVFILISSFLHDL